MKRACICDEVGHLLLQPVSTLFHLPGRRILRSTPKGTMRKREPQAILKTDERS